MIELGSMMVRDEDSITEVRQKVFGLVRDLQGAEVLATRAATAVSEIGKRCLQSIGPTIVHVALVDAAHGMRMQLRVRTNGVTIDAGRLGVFFDHFALSEDGSTNSMTAELAVPMPRGQITCDFIEHQRARLARKSRAELMDELQVKNRQLEEYNDNLEATVAQRTAELQVANTRMQRDLEAGSDYVRALIPPPMHEPLSIRWKYVPSSTLGGDTIGYHWIDSDHLAMYLVDVTGHGLDSALLAVTITNVIRSHSLPNVDMKCPDQVVAGLNEAFQGEHHSHKYFTIWYGAYQPKRRTLSWSGGGHHPAVLLMRGEHAPRLLESSGPPMGCAPGMEFPTDSCAVAPGSRLLLFSDGIFEILRDDHLVWSLQGAIDFVSKWSSSSESLLESLLAHARELRGSEHLDDDFSIIEAMFE